MTRPSTGGCDKRSCVTLSRREFRSTWRSQERAAARSGCGSFPAGHAVEASSELNLSPARTSALTDAVLREQLSRLGETRYALRNLEIKYPGRRFHSDWIY